MVTLIGRSVSGGPEYIIMISFIETGSRSRNALYMPPHGVLESRFYINAIARWGTAKFSETATRLG
jgi:hypothetical protein